MTTVSTLRKLLDRKVWEACTPCPTATAAGHFVVRTPLNWPKPMALIVQGTSTHYLYYPEEDGYLEIPGGTLGAIAAGSCGVFHPYGPTGTATAGSATTLTTNLTIPGDLAGYTIRITGGTGIGQEKTIVSSTQGANAVITTSTWSVTPDNTSVYLILSGRFWCLGATGAAVVWKYYDVATNAWTTKSVTSGPGATWATDGQAEATSGAGQSATIASGTATAGAAGTLTNSGKNWATNQWANYQVRLTGGTGAGQIRTINSNTATVLTVSANWTINPDATSTYVIEGNDDWIYVAGNNAVTLFRYAINGIAGLSANAQATGDTWITVAPGVARGTAPSTGMCLRWVSGSTDSRWTDETAIINGRRLYSFRGGATGNLDYYDIPSNGWTNTVTYNRLAGPTFTTGSSWSEARGVFYVQKDATGRFYRYNVATSNMDGLGQLLYAQGAAVLGDKTFVFTYKDGSTELDFLYNLRNTGTELFRMLII